MEKAESLKEKIKGFLEISGSFEFLSFRRGNVFFKEGLLTHFTFDDIGDAVKLINSKRKREIIEDFIMHLRKKKDIFKSRPEYINIKFNLVNKDKVFNFLRSSKYPSFRAFIIDEIARAFGVSWKGNFSVSSSKEPSAGQVLIPLELFERIRQKIGKEEGKLDKSYVRHKIARKIEEILSKIE